MGLEYAWDQQSVWSQVANNLKKRLRTARLAALGLAISAAILATTGAVVGLASGAGKCLAALSAICAGSTAVTQRWTGPDQVRSWTRARSVSEGIKTEVYLALAGLGRPDVDKRIEEIVENGKDLRDYSTGISPKPRSLPEIYNPASYLDVRVKSQIDDYYDERVNTLKRHLTLFRAAEVFLAALGVVFGAAAGTWEIDGLAVWVPVITTVGAAITAHAAAERLSDSLIEFSRTADELRRIYYRHGTAAGMTDEERVRRAEAVISIENQAWMARIADGDQKAS